MNATLLHTQQLTTGYTPQKPISQALSLSLQAGQLVSLLGANGAGKSTLMRTLAGMQPALAGRVCVMGQDIARLSAQDRAKHLSVVLTERPEVGLMRARDVVALGRSPYTSWSGRLSATDRAKIAWAIDTLGVQALAETPFMELSDGQRQKVMIARAIAQEARVILLDEPTAYLDLPRRVEMMHTLQRLAHDMGRAVLVITHDLDLALRTADALWLMEGGGAVHVGAPEDLVLSGTFEAVFKSEQLHFDAATGTFSQPLPANTLIAVVGEGVSAAWTHRALQRLGYPTTNQPQADAAATVTLHKDPQRLAWQLLWGQRQRAEYHSIGELLNGVQQYAQQKTPNA